MSTEGAGPRIEGITTNRRVDDGHDDLDPIRTRDGFHGELARLRAESSFSYRRLAELIDSRPSTVHGWINGRHLPYQRDNDAFERLLNTLGVADTAPWMSVLTTLRNQSETETNPYPGLRPYSSDEAALFFGREHDQTRVDLLIDRHRRAQSAAPIIVTGASGIGKSSLVNITTGARAEQWKRFNATEIQVGGEAHGTQLDIALGTKHIVIDQGEQLLGGRVRSPIFDQLEGFAQLGGTVLVVLRSDYFDLALSDPWLTRGLQDWSYTVGPLSVDALASAIVGPAAFVGRSVEADLVAALTVDFADEFDGDRRVGALPLLSFVLHEIAASSTHELTLGQYDELGGLRGALDNAAEETFQSLDAAGQRASHRLFLHLVDLSSDAPARRRIAPYDSPAEKEWRAYDDAVTAFVARRLVEATDLGLSVAHEALFHSWRRLDRWIDESRDELVAYSELQSQTERWVHGGERADDLLRGVRLAAAREITDSPALSDRVTEDERRFVELSQASLDRAHDAERRRSRRFRNLAIATAMVAVVAVVLGLGARAAQRHAAAAERSAVSRELTLVGQGFADDDPVLAGQIALAADHVEETLQSRSALLDLGTKVPKARYPSAPTTVALGASANGALVAYSDPVTGEIHLLEPAPNGLLAEIATIDGAGETYALAISADGRWLVAGGVDRVLRAWDLDNPAQPRSVDSLNVEFDNAVQSIHAVDDDQFIASGTGLTVVRLRLTNEGVEQLPALPIEGTVWGVGASPDGRLLATAGNDGAVHVFDAESGAEVTTMQDPAGVAATSVDISNDGSLLVVGFRTSGFKLWDIANLEEPVEITPGDQAFTTWVNWVGFSPDGKLLIAGSADGTAQVWRTSDWTLAGPTLRHPANVVRGSWIDDGSVAMSTANGEVSVWKLDTPQFITLNGGVWSASFAPDGATGLMTSSRRIAVVAADGDTIEVAAAIPFVTEVDAADLFHASAEGVISPDGKSAFLGGRDGTVIATDLSVTDHVRATQNYVGLTDLVEQVALSPDGRLLAAGADDNHVAVWKVDGDGTPTSIDELPGLGLSLAFSPDGSLLAVGTAKQLIVYSVDGDGTISRLSETTISDSETYTVAFHPSQAVLAIGSDDAKVRLYDLSDPSEPTLIGEPIGGAYSRIYEVTFSADGRYLAAGASLALVWNVEDLENPQLWARLEPRNDVYSIRFNNATQQLVGGGAAGEIYVWDLDVDMVRRELCEQGGTPITPEEWTQYVATAGIPYDPPCGGETAAS